MTDNHIVITRLTTTDYRYVCVSKKVRVGHVNIEEKGLHHWFVPPHQKLCEMTSHSVQPDTLLSTFQPVYKTLHERTKHQKGLLEWVAFFTYNMITLISWDWTPTKTLKEII
jgi:hypothetical protein